MLAQSASRVRWTQRTLPQARNIIFSCNTQDEIEARGHIRLMERFVAEHKPSVKWIASSHSAADVQLIRSCRFFPAEWRRRPNCWNTFRSVNIASVNELKLVYAGMGAITGRVLIRRTRNRSVPFHLTPKLGEMHRENSKHLLAHQ